MLDIDALIKEAKDSVKAKKKAGKKKRASNLARLFDDSPRPEERPVIPWRSVAVVAIFYRSTCKCGHVMEYPEPGNCFVRNVDIRKKETKHDIATPCAMLPDHLPRIVEWREVTVNHCPGCYKDQRFQLKLDLPKPKDPERFERIAQWSEDIYHKQEIPQ